MTAFTEKEGLLFAVAQPQQPGVWIQVPDSYREPPSDPGMPWARMVEIAGRLPDAIAIADGRVRVTYSELVDRARKVAGLVVGHLEGKKAPVGLLIESNVELISAILGTLAAGQAHLLLDSSAPPARLARILERSGAGLLLTSVPGLEKAAAAAGGVVPVLSIEELPPPLADADLPVVAPNDPALLLYTSGSTGEPKGVPRSMRYVSATSDRSIHAYRLSPSDRIAMSSPLNFGYGYVVMWASLLSGANLLFYDVGRKGVAGLAEWLQAERITYLPLVPSVFRALCASSTPGTVFPDVRCVRISGDRALAADFALFRRHFTDRAVLVNTLGMSEVGTLTRFFANRDTSIGEVFPVGYPARSGAVRVVGTAGEEVATGSVGEIVVWREAVLDYWNDPERSGEAFVADPNGGFLFHTGDLAIRRPDGCLEYVGRRDSRVKVDGQAVEIGEVEDALLRCDGIDEAVVAAFQDRSGGVRLVGYVRGDFKPAERIGIRAQLAERLPPYMIPVTLMQLDTMPMTDRGKVNREALPVPAWADTSEAGPHDDPHEVIRTALVALSGVRSALVVDWPGATGMAELVAYYVPVHNGVRSVSVRRALNARLPAELVPARLIPVDELPTAGEILPDPQSSPIPAKLFDESTFDLDYRIASFFEETLGATVDFDDSFFELGGTSLQAMEVFGKIDAAYGVNLSPTTIVEAPTPRALAELIEGRRFRVRRSSLVPMRVDGSKTPILHVHGGRGHVLHLWGLVQYADADRPMYGFEQPGLHGGAPPLRTVEEMALAYVTDLRRVLPKGPYAFMGHSFGGMVALEMAQLLTAAGEEVSLLTIFDTKFSHVSRPDAPVSKRRRLSPARVLAGLQRRARHRLKRARLGAKLRLGWPIAYDQRTLYFYLLHLDAGKKYRPKPYSGRVLVISEQGWTDYHQRVWSEIAPGNFEIVELPVQHDQLIEEPYIVDVMREVEARVDA